jgi:hypothetical protein
MTKLYQGSLMYSHDSRDYSPGALNHTTKNLLFLFGAAPMGMTGCLGSSDDSDTLITLTTAPFTTFNNDDETTGDGDSTSGDGDGDPTAGDGDGDPTTGDGDGDPTTGDGDGDSGDGDGDPTTGDGDGDPTTGDGDGDGDSTTGGNVGDLCTPYSELVGECYGPEVIDDAYMSCVSYYGMFQGQPACLDAFEAFLVCISQLPCADFGDFVGCEQQYDDYVTNCG